MTTCLRRLLLPALSLSACGVPPVEEAPPDLAAPGRFAVGHLRLDVDAGERVLPVEVWYPAAEAAPPSATLDLERGRAEADLLAPLLEAAPADCVRTTTGAAADAAPAPGSWPVVVFSHCHACVRWSMGSVAERLASHGIVVAAPDHVGNTLYDRLSGAPDLLSGPFLVTRGEDVSAVLDALEVGEGLPPALASSLDTARVGVMGHSFGAATVGRVLQEDDRFLAGFAVAAPVQSPLLPGVDVAAIAEPLAFLLAEEDNSITEVGNALLRANAEALAGAAWLVEVADAGHWSFSDIAGLTEAFAPGCGDGQRQTVPGEPFTYLPTAVARELAAVVATHVFAGTLRDDAAALDALTDGGVLRGLGADLSVSTP